MGIVYILTNEAMPGLVKIGVTDTTIKQRIKELSNTSVPFEFECVYAVEISGDAKVIEGLIHRGLGSLDHQGLGSLERIRVHPRKEFFRIPAEGARSILKVVEEMGGKDVTPASNITEDPIEQQARENSRKRRSRFRFYMLGLEDGEKLQFRNDQSIECEVADRRKMVKFNDVVMSLSSAASTILGYRVSGPMYWCWRGKTLDEWRREEDEEN